MEFIRENLNSAGLNINNFSKMIGFNLKIPVDTIKNYLLASISILIVRNTELKKQITKLYILDSSRYYNAAVNSSAINHVIMTEGTLEMEVEGRKALGVLLIAEEDYNLRNTVLNLLRKSYPTVFNAVKKHSKKDLAKKYLQMDEITRKIEARLDASLYLYFCIYRYNEAVDQNFIKSIVEDIKFFEFFHPITRIINKELDFHKSELKEIKSLLKREYGKLNSYKDILNCKDKEISHLGKVIENLFIINKLDVNFLFNNSNFINIDEIILSYIKTTDKSPDSKKILQITINGIFIKSLINEYKKCRELYFENNQERLLFKINSLEEELSKIKEENAKLSAKVISLEEEKDLFDRILNRQKNSLNRKHKFELLALESRINEFENQLSLEKKYRDELNQLREYVFKINNNYTPSSSNKTLDYFIARSKLLIIGGTKEWRRKFRDKYPELRTLTGFNGNFDTNILINYDYIFFYTGFMDHATYYKAINFIRSNQIKFGYIGKTNMELVEDEIIDELQKYDTY